MNQRGKEHQVTEEPKPKLHCTTAGKGYRQNQEFLKGILSSLHETMIIVYDREGNLRTVIGPPEMEERYDMRATDLVGKSLADIFPPQEAEERTARIQLILKTGASFQQEYLFHAPTGDFWHDVSLVPMHGRSGKPSMVVGFIRDITTRKRVEEELRQYQSNLERLVAERSAELTKANERLQGEIEERKRVEAELRASETKYRLVVENSSQGILVAQNGMARFVNRKLSEASGYSEEELTSRPFLEFIHPEDKSLVADRYQKRLKGEKVLPLYSFRAIDKQGNTRWFEINAVGIDWGGKPAALNFLSDITERRRAEEERGRLETRLLEAEKMKAIGILAGGVAHDLNNMLGGLVSYPELLLMQIPQDSPLREPLLTIQRSGEKAAAIVQDLLTMARRGVVAPEVVNLNQVVSEYLKSPEHEKVQFYHPRVEVETNFEPNLPNIVGSPVHLSKTVMNLVSNAAEAMANGGKIVISTEARYVDRPIRGYEDIEEGDYVTLSVSDTGVGIPPDEVKRIFEPFYTKKVLGRSGTGLGMAVVWWTVKHHNGCIDIQTSEGRGTRFTLYFSATQSEPTKGASPLQADEYMGKGESILVVDDVREQRKIASMILKRLGYSVTVVSSGEEAVDYMKSNSADLLVLDMIMDPGIDGLETYRQIRKLRPHQRAVLVSGFSETERVKEAQRLGAGSYVRKPYSMEKIGAAIRVELDK